ncbi:MAG: acyl-CoA dehydrogenase [Deltaproteobacteria bacterium]|nr:acyl-CoA dehydrogenase [Deltaproteobacteria bacterium]
MDFGFTPAQQALIERVSALAKERMAPRAAQYDADFAMPADDLLDIHREGWLLANLDKKRGGLGFGLYGDDPLSFFLIDEHLAYGNPSTAHCFQVHNNGLMMIDAMASDEQIQKWIEPTINRGALLPGAGAEPLGVPPTAAKKVAGGYLLSGTKHYATNASMAEWLWIGRIASDFHPKPIMCMLHKDTPGLTIDTEAWRPTGMRACVSPWLYLKDCFVPEENLLGRPGQFLDENWMGKINFAFTANYLGSARAMYDWALAYIRERGGGKDSYRQLRFGELKAMLDAARLTLYTAVRMFKKNSNEAMIAAHQAKWLAKEMLEKMIWSTAEICGSTALFVKHPLERFYRDMHLHMMHGRHDIAAQIVGASELGEPFDTNRNH